MFLHNLKYEIISSLHVKDLIIWLILFPIVLGTLFKVAFSSLYEKYDKFSAVPVAIVESEPQPELHQIMDSVAEGDQPFLKITYTDEEKAKEMLDNSDITGIIYANKSLSLTVSDTGIAQTMLRNFIERYNAAQKTISESIAANPAAAQEIIKAATEELKPVTDIPLTNGNTDYYTDYFYNLIAMVALYGSLTGLHITIQNQGNLSKLGARKCCSPTPKSVSLLASLIGSFLVQTICMVICVTYLRFVLRIDFGSRLPLVYASGILGGIMGVSLGFCVGSIGALKTEMKTGICLAVSMFLCFCSGLMVGNMKAIIESKAPWFNKINPAAVVSDCFYYLNVDNDYQRYKAKMLMLALLSIVMILIGFVMTRRKKYASL